MTKNSLTAILHQGAVLNKTAYRCLALTVIAALSGCASLTTGTTQSVTVVTRDKGVSAEGAKCELINDKGKWQIISPGSATIHRSTQDLVVRCELKGYETGLTILRSSAGTIWGNLIAGGLIGYAIDAGQGADYDYPSLITIDLVHLTDTALSTSTISPP